MKIDPGQHFQMESLNKRPQKEKGAESTNAASTPSTVINLSNSAKQLNGADGLEAHEEVRPDKVAEAKAELADWKGLSDDQVDHIMDRMFNELN